MRPCFTQMPSSTKVNPPTPFTMYVSSQNHLCVYSYVVSAGMNMCARE